MPRSKSRKTAHPGRVRLPRQVLLPLPDTYVRGQSLASHLALAGCGAADGNQHSLNELIRITYLAFLLWEAGYGDADAQLFFDSETALDTAVVRAQQNASWRLEETEAALMKRVLRLYDEQLSGVPTRSFLMAEARLGNLLSKAGNASPISRKAPSPRQSV
ncbi:hypothetical protein [Paraburkholderia sp. HD33-4]|uniref:hypothetical protein n=1 Tax=Paraburkholderia sp. HD33-4 TaxID=2883242 RepID=UPI001F17DF6C|nr:hypothetical protein [Paraburkholderia sp. HD33-4]